MPHDYLKDNLSPLHTILLFLYDQLPDKLYCCGHDNTHMYAKFNKIVLKRKVYFNRFSHKGILLAVTLTLEGVYS